MASNDQPERRKALVTGTSYGFGQAIAARLARDGFDVAATDLPGTDLSETVAAIEAAGAKALPLELDLRSLDSIGAVASAAIEELGRIDVLVNNAGTLLLKPALEISPDEWRNVMTINIDGSFYMAQQVARHLVETGREGVIINLASTFSVIGVPNVAAYGVSKSAIAGMTRHLAAEWAPYGIRVNAIGPGSTETKIRRELLARNPERRAATLAKIPLQRFGEPDDIAGAASYLASDDARYMTGHLLMVDGGLTIT
jgi:NAD(P)-dependent dehydrogenase (short-subunit alcohol dehydrogenase family)